MKTPSFWYKDSIISLFLLPITAIYILIFSLRKIFSKAELIRNNSIIIGNGNIGGGGKTPFIFALAELLGEDNITILSRGYKALEKGPLIVKASDDPKEVGDEPLMYAQKYPIIISKNRLKAKNLIEELNNKFLLLDDGLQNPKIKSNLKILLIDNQIAFGNNYVFPSGPNRFFINYNIRNADIVIIIKRTQNETLNPEILHRVNKFSKKYFSAYGDIPEADSALKYLAFSGLAVNKKFFSSLRHANYQIVKKMEFPDHYYYKESDLRKIVKIAEDNQLQIITTLKDYIKLSDEFKRKIKFIDYKIVINNKEELIREITENLERS